VAPAARSLTAGSTICAWASGILPTRPSRFGLRCPRAPLSAHAAKGGSRGGVLGLVGLSILPPFCVLRFCYDSAAATAHLTHCLGSLCPRLPFGLSAVFTTLGLIRSPSWHCNLCAPDTSRHNHKSGEWMAIFQLLPPSALSRRSVRADEMNELDPTRRLCPEPENQRNPAKR